MLSAMDHAKNIIANALFTALMDPSDAGNGTTWDPIHMQPEVADHAAKAVVRALVAAGYDLTAKPDA